MNKKNWISIHNKDNSLFINKDKIVRIEMRKENDLFSLIAVLENKDEYLIESFKNQWYCIEYLMNEIDT